MVAQRTARTSDKKLPSALYRCRTLLSDFSVLDAMHNLFLGEFKRHCREIWGLTSTQSHDVHTPEEQARMIEDLREAIQSGSPSEIRSFRRGYLHAFVKANGLSIPEKITKESLTTVLVNWVSAVNHSLLTCVH